MKAYPLSRYQRLVGISGGLVTGTFKVLRARVGDRAWVETVDVTVSDDEDHRSGIVLYSGDLTASVENGVADLRDYMIHPDTKRAAVLAAEDAMRAALVGAAAQFPETLPEIVVLCGSTRFYDAFQEANYRLTMEGCIVLSVGFYPHAKAEHGHGEGVGHDSEEKVALDELHKRKIDLADRVLVLNVGGYIGQSTRSEIEYAAHLGRPIDFLEPPVSARASSMDEIHAERAARRESR